MKKYSKQVISKTSKFNQVYPFGMVMPGREYTSGGNSQRHGYNFQENEQELGKAITSADFWLYSACLGRRYNIDPMPDDSRSHYCINFNSPISFMDPKGLFGSRKEARQYKKDNNIKGNIIHDEEHSLYMIVDKQNDLTYIRHESYGPNIVGYIGDGVVRAATIFANKTKPKKNIEDNIEKIAIKLNVEKYVIMAVVKVESNGSGFNNGQVTIRYEGHYMMKYITNSGFDVSKLKSEGYDDILYTYKQGKSTHKKNHSYSAYNKALELDPESAMMSTSYGAFQIMGFNYKAAGFETVQEFVQLQNTYDGQVEAFVNFISSYPVLLKALREKDFTTFAKNYNGPSYKDNKYDEKMKEFYENLIKNASKK